MFLFLGFLGFMHGLFRVYLKSDEQINGFFEHSRFTLERVINESLGTFTANITQRHPAFRSPNTLGSPKMMLPTIVPTDVREFGTNAGCNNGHLESLLFSIRPIRSKEKQRVSAVFWAAKITSTRVFWVEFA